VEKRRNENTIRTREVAKDNRKEAPEEHIRDELIDEDFLIEEVTEDDIKTWYYIDHGEINGAYSRDEMLAMYDDGTLKETTEVWNNTMSDWTELSQTELYREKPPVRSIRSTRKQRKGHPSKRELPYLILSGAIGLIIIILCIRVVLMTIGSKSEPEGNQVTEETALTEDTEETIDDKGVTVKKLVEKYFTDPSYDLQEQEDGSSLLTVTGTINYEGKEQEAELVFRVEEDGSVHYEQMSFGGELQEDTVYQDLLDQVQKP
jgi:hypothetical protein